MRARLGLPNAVSDRPAMAVGVDCAASPTDF
jgi:hypothetical protein